MKRNSSFPPSSPPCSVRARSRHAQPTRPNIIAIVTDDQARWSIGAYGNTRSRTPNMDRLAAEGALFANAFIATPVCSPSRASVPHGPARHAGRHHRLDQHERGRRRRRPAAGDRHLAGGAQAERLRDRAGRQVAPRPPPAVHPTKHGYDHFWGFLGGGAAADGPARRGRRQAHAAQGPAPDLLTDEAHPLDRGEQRQAVRALASTSASRTCRTRPVPEEDARRSRTLDPTIPDVRRRSTRRARRTLTRQYYAARPRGRPQPRPAAGEARRAEAGGQHDRPVHQRPRLQHRPPRHPRARATATGSAAACAGPKRPNMFEESIRVPLLVRWPGVVKPGTRDRAAGHATSTRSPASSACSASRRPPTRKQHGRDFSPAAPRRDSRRTGATKSSPSTTCTTPGSRSCG